MMRFTAGDVDIAAGQCAGNDEGTGFDAVGNDAMTRATQPGYTLHTNRGSTGAVDFRAHLDQQIGEVDHFRFTGAVLYQSLAIGEGGGHHDIFGAGHGDAIEDNFGSTEAVGGGFDVAVFLGDFGSQLLKALDVKIDGTGA